ncbi:hypothetical protein [Paenibacillus sp. FSL R5-0519]|uniref:hypothetical protein n=1 Tax=Paenibacillus sp. FSL R5-0519 TaxID=2921648 RepID=UPI0030DC1EE9
MSNATQYREVSRKANAGERIKIVNVILSGGRYNAGDEFVVDRAATYGVYVNYTKGNVTGTAGIHDNEYVVLEPIAPSTAPLPDLFAQFIRDNAPAVRSYLAEIDPDKCAESTKDENVSDPQPAPLTRAKVIEMARARVTELERIGRDDDARLEGSPLRGTWYEIDYVVNRDKRAVTALVYHLNGFTYARKRRKPDAVGIAKCAPDDVFNADIGKAVAAERALGLTLTDAFVNAPKPAEPVVGMRVENRGRVRTVVASSKDYVYGKTGTLKSQGVRESRIIDDTDAEYTQQDGEAA